MGDDSVIYVVDDDTAVLDSLRWVLESAGHSVETFSSAARFLAACDPNRAGCLVLDVRMPGMNGIELQHVLAERQIAMPIIFITAHGTVPTAVRAIQHGAVDFLMKPYNNTTLLERIDLCLAMQRSRRESAKSQAALAARLAVLTPRERDVLDGVIVGRSNKAIASSLGISEKTVETHRARVMQKMHAGSLAELVRLVVTNGHASGKP
jgi:FixJ family two-component response regulator